MRKIECTILFCFVLFDDGTSSAWGEFRSADVCKYATTHESLEFSDVKDVGCTQKKCYVWLKDGKLYFFDSKDYCLSFYEGVTRVISNGQFQQHRIFFEKRDKRYLVAADTIYEESKNSDDAQHVETTQLVAYMLTTDGAIQHIFPGVSPRLTNALYTPYSGIDLTQGVKEISCAMGVCGAVKSDTSAFVFYPEEYANEFFFGVEWNDDSDINSDLPDLSSGVKTVTCSHRICAFIFESGKAELFGSKLRLDKDLTSLDFSKNVKDFSSVYSGTRLVQ